MVMVRHLASVAFSVSLWICLASSSPQWCNTTNPSCSISILTPVYCALRYPSTVINLTTDVVSRLDEEGDVLVSVNVSAGEGNRSALYYKLCVNVNLADNYLIDCVESNRSSLKANYTWSTAGLAIVSARVYSSPNATFEKMVACAVSNTTVANKEGLNVGVSWQGFEFPFVPTNTNITAMTAVNVSASSRAAIQWSSYSYDFGDSNTTVDTQQQNQTHVYSRNGTYNFSVAVLAMVNDFHAYEGHYEAQIVAQDVIRSINMTINKNNTVPKGKSVDVVLSVDGSLPVQACWFVVKVNNTIGNESDFTLCRMMNSSVKSVPQVFNFTGKYYLNGTFSNNVSSKNDRFHFEVVPVGPFPTPTVIATSTVVLVVVASIVCVVLLLVVGVYVPYRRYKQRHVEKADFRFIHLSKQSTWKRIKVKFLKLKDRWTSSNAASGRVHVNIDNSYGATKVRGFSDHERL